MTMLKRTTSALLLIASCMHANASCMLFSDQSVMLAQDEGLGCQEFSDSWDYIEQQVTSLGGLLDEDSEPTEDYWSDWALKTKDAPILTQNISTNYFGLGMWLPEDLEETKNDMTTQEWLLNHGLQLSVGFGDKVNGQPRLRFDYRWHDERDANMMMQVELPF
ncbi:hypothetical protein [Vibrio sp. 99-70-13A1]|uniref:hypothetical protein n=1 Tax=Vibrio sp. 99-70-13A1 TaxID=2607601 RepID=UPI0014938D99|nr:hypothetical protein [Vibrio sp. 99-70-13A1]NOH95769.1 hypothetical protein [Vibrio sp. 99-70-13A1]